MCGNCRTLMEAVYETGLALDDIILYLDTHPGCPEAWNYFHCMKEQHLAAVAAYEQSCGPLSAAGATRNFNWTDSPWPWEGGRC